MNLIDILLLAFALSIDATVVSFSYGIKKDKQFLVSALSLALFTGAFQALMPLLGGICAECVRVYIQPFSKWIVFAIFLYLGINFIKESFEEKDNSKTLTLNVLLLIAIATSIDAFSVGIPLTLKLDSIIFPVIVIGVVTFIDSLIGYFTGRVFSKLNTKYLEILGGFILILLALKVVL